MMFKSCFLLLLLAHFLGDFYFQGSKTAENKNTSPKSFIIHCALYAAAGAVVFAPVWNNAFFLPLALFSLSHAATDAAKIYVKRIKSHGDTSRAGIETITFWVDQLVHLVFITAVSLYITSRGVGLTTLPGLAVWLSYAGVDYMFCIKLMLLILGNIRPCNIMIVITAKSHKPADDEQNVNETVGAGSVIGVLERYLITLFFAIGQYASVGLVLTAKSIARYSKLNDDKNFAEYYLMGTLLSSFYSLVLCILVKYLG